MKRLSIIVYLAIGFNIFCAHALLAQAIPTISATRNLPGSYTPGTAVDVSIFFYYNSPLPNALIMNEYVPTSWTLISLDNGTYNPSTGLIKLGVSSALFPDSLNYSFLVPESYVETATFYGEILYLDPANSGAETTEIIGGDTQLSVVFEPLSSSLFIAGGATLGFRRLWKKRRTV